MTEASAASGRRSILEDARSLTLSPGYPCLVAKLISQMGDELREAIESDVQASALERALRNRGVVLPGSTITRHRRGECRCNR